MPIVSARAAPRRPARAIWLQKRGRQARARPRARRPRCPAAFLLARTAPPTAETAPLQRAKATARTTRDPFAIRRAIGGARTPRALAARRHPRRRAAPARPRCWGRTIARAARVRRSHRRRPCAGRPIGLARARCSSSRRRHASAAGRASASARSSSSSSRRFGGSALKAADPEELRGSCRRMTALPLADRVRRVRELQRGGARSSGCRRRSHPPRHRRMRSAGCPIVALQRPVCRHASASGSRSSLSGASIASTARARAPLAERHEGLVGCGVANPTPERRRTVWPRPTTTGNSETTRQTRAVCVRSRRPRRRATRNRRQSFGKRRAPAAKLRYPPLRPLSSSKCATHGAGGAPPRPRDRREIIGANGPPRAASDRLAKCRRVLGILRWTCARSSAPRPDSSRPGQSVDGTTLDGMLRGRGAIWRGARAQDVCAATAPSRRCWRAPNARAGHTSGQRSESASSNLAAMRKHMASSTDTAPPLQVPRLRRPGLRTCRASIRVDHRPLSVPASPPRPFDAGRSRGSEGLPGRAGMGPLRVLNAAPLPANSDLSEAVRRRRSSLAPTGLWRAHRRRRRRRRRRRLARERCATYAADHPVRRRARTRQASARAPVA